jgi:hypothetical protein
MSRRADCWDNAVVESFNATIKTELIHRTKWQTREQARAAVYKYIEIGTIQSLFIRRSATAARSSSSRVNQTITRSCGKRRRAAESVDPPDPPIPQHLLRLTRLQEDESREWLNHSSAKSGHAQNALSCMTL